MWSLTMTSLTTARRRRHAQPRLRALSGAPGQFQQQHDRRQSLLRQRPDTGDAATAGPIGINISSVAPVYGTMISQNTFDKETIDVAIKAPGGLVAAHLNNFNNSATGVGNMGMGSVDATENWWGCILGPGHSGCATKAGSVFSTPWLLTPFVSNSR